MPGARVGRLDANGSAGVSFLPAGTTSRCQALAGSVLEGRCMTKRLKLHDRVSWSSEAGRVSGRIVKVHTKDVNDKGYVHHAGRDEPQYEIKSAKPDHVARHKRTAM